MALGVLSREAIERAILEYEELGRDAFLSKHGFGRATAYALVHNGKEYDPKAIAGVAYGFDHPDRGTPKNTEFNGGLQLRSALNPAGFEVVLRTNQGSTVLRDILERFMDSYSTSRSEPFSGDHPTQKILKNLQDSFIASSALSERPEVKVDASAGKGNWSLVPWVAFLDSRVTTSTQAGVYPVLLFREDMSGAYITVAQGTTKLEKDLGRRRMREQLAAVAEALRTKTTPDLQIRGFQPNNELELGNGELARAYEASTIIHKFYDRNQLPDDAEILEDVDAAMNLVEENIESLTERAHAHAGGVELLPEVVRAFRKAVDDSGLRVPTGHGDRVTGFISALVAKPFVILSGMSGSGKTQIALRLGEWFGAGPQGRRFLPLSVRPDWTGPEALFGYEDALRPPKDGKAAWFVPRTLEFMLAAAREPDMPYLLLLDEMNLAHVERYFSDFLSGVESRDAILPHLSREPDGEWRLISTAEPLAPLPRNLFVVGTVNVDETTYQFSPKVLDRATTFEVRTTADELDSSGSRPSAVLPAATQYLRTLVNLVLDDGWQGGSARGTAVANALRKLHAELALTDDEFGHRLFYESLRLSAALESAGVTDQNPLLDHLVLLKVLPRIHGSRRRVEPVLKRLASFAADPDANKEYDPAALDDPSLPMTMAKIRRMLRSVEINQFVSFTD